jgi:curved DNA-binding protein CbpA
MYSYQIDRGLFQHDFIDHYAILGVSLNANSQEIRKRYLKVVYQLHPDTCKAKGQGNREKATQLLSKLVNPAYEELKKDRIRAEHQLILPQIAERMVQQGVKINVTGETAKSLAKVDAGTIDQTYNQLLKELAQIEYQDLHLALDKVAEISELNLVYLLRKYGRNAKRTSNSVEKDTVGQSETASTPSARSVTEAYTRRAKVYIEKENFAQAILELREGLKLDPNDSTCHSLLGWAYLKLNKQKMAQIHVKKALQGNPKEELALKAKRVLEQREGKKLGKRNVSADDSSKQSGGILGGLFGGKKKV